MFSTSGRVNSSSAAAAAGSPASCIFSLAGKPQQIRKSNLVRSHPSSLHHNSRHQGHGGRSTGAKRLDPQQHQQQHSPQERQRRRMQWEQKFADVTSWQQLYEAPVFLQRPLLYNKAPTYMSAAALVARVVKRQRDQTQPGGGQNQQQHGIQRKHQHKQLPLPLQQPAEACKLWLWYVDIILLGCLIHLPDKAAAEEEQQQQQKPPAKGAGGWAAAPELLDTVTAAALLQATAAIGWHTDTIAAVTGSQDAPHQLTSTCLKLFDAGLQAAREPLSSSNQQEVAQAAQCCTCPPVAVINLVTARQQLGVLLDRDSLKQQQDDVLVAALSSSSSSAGSQSRRSSCDSRTIGGGSGSSDGDGSVRCRVGVGYPALLKLLTGHVLSGEVMAADVMQLVVAGVQEHIINNPQQLLPLLQRLISLRKRQLWIDGRQVLQDFRVALLLSLQQNNVSWLHLVELLQQQVVLKVYGPPAGQDRASRRSGSSSRSSSSSSRAPFGSDKRSSRSHSNSGAGAGAGAAGRLSGAELQKLMARERLPSVKCSFKDVALLSDVLVQLPPHRYLAGLKQVLLTAGVQLLERSTKTASHARSSSSSSSTSSVSLLPKDISSWLRSMASMYVAIPTAQREQLATMLLDFLPSLHTDEDDCGLAAAAAHSGPPSQPHSGPRGSVGGTGSGRAWSLHTRLTLVSAACDLQLPSAAGPEWWPAVLHLVLQPQQHALKPDQALLLLQCMVRARHKPMHQEVAQVVELISKQWLTSASPDITADTDTKPVTAAAAADSSRNGTGVNSRRQKSGRQQPSPGQLIEVLRVLASLRHKPQMPGGSRQAWWAAYQHSLLRGMQQQQQDIVQQRVPPAELSPGQRSWWLRQQQADAQLDGSAAVRVLWAVGRLGFNPEPSLLALLLRLLDSHIQGVEFRQLLGAFVGLASILKHQPAALSSQAYRQLCDQLQQGQPGPADVANLLRCFGSIAGSTGAAAAAAGSDPNKQDLRQLPEQRQQKQDVVQLQEQLLPPAGVVNWLLSCVEHKLDELSDTALTMVLWGLRKLGHLPAQDWMDRYQSEVLSRATSNPGLPDHEVAIITASMVHLGVQVHLDLLQQLLFRAPRTNLSLGIMADLTAALRKLEQVDPDTWQQQLDQQQTQQEQLQSSADELPKWRQRQQRIKQQQQQQQLLQYGVDRARTEPVQAVDSSTDPSPASMGQAASADNDEPDLDVDALIDTARLRLGALGLEGSRQQPQQVQVGEAADDGGAEAADEVLDEAICQRLANRLAIIEELVHDSTK